MRIAALLQSTIASLACTFALGVISATHGLAQVPEASERSPSVAATFTPPRIGSYIPRGATRTYEIIANVEKAVTLAPVQVALVFDTTSSMGPVIENMVARAAELMQRVRQRLPNSEFMVAGFADYPGVFTTEGDGAPWQIYIGFTADTAAVETALRSIRLSDGGDVDEAYSRALYEVSRLVWRAGSRKLLILFGDSIAHEVDPGPDGRLGTGDDLRWDAVVAGLAHAGIQALGIYAPERPEVAQRFEEMARATGGLAMAIDASGSAADAMLAALGASSLVKPILGIPEDQGAWIKEVSPPRQLSPTHYAFTVVVAAPEDAPMGRNDKLFLNAWLDDPGRSPLDRPRVLVTTGWINAPWVPWIAPGLIVLAIVAVCFRFLHQRRLHAGLLLFNEARLVRRFLARTLVAGLLALALVTSVKWAESAGRTEEPVMSERLAELLARLLNRNS